MDTFNKNANLSDERANLAASVLMECSERVLSAFLAALPGTEGPDKYKDLVLPVQMELVIFSLHLTDRIAFGRFGSDQRMIFMNAILPIVQRRLPPPLDSELRDLYNLRNAFYGRFPKLFAEKDEPLQGTLFWEFGKAFASVYANSNPATTVQASIMGMDFMTSVNTDLAAAGVI